MPNNTHLQVGHGEDEILTLFKALGELQRSRSTTRRGLDGLTPEERSAEANFSIDPGFVNHRLVDTLLRTSDAMDLIDDNIRRLPDLPDWLQTKRISQIYSEVLLGICKVGNAKSLSWLAAQPNPHPGTIIRSTDVFQGTSSVFKARRAKTTWIPDCRFDGTVCLVFSTEHIFGSTHREALSQRSVISYIARLKQVVGRNLILEPLVMGAPWVEGIDPDLRDQLIWHRYDFYEQYVEDVDEFSVVKNIPNDINWSPIHSTLAIWEWSPCRLGKGGPLLCRNSVKSGEEVDITKFRSLLYPLNKALIWLPFSLVSVFQKNGQSRDT